MAESSAATVTLHVLTPSGSIDAVSAAPSDTVLMLKKRLSSQGFHSAPSSALRLIFGTDVLRDDVLLSEAGLRDGDQLSVVVSFAPHGNYVAKFEGHFGPAGLNTWATIKADFSDDGTFDITMDESEITSDDEDEDYDEYAEGAAWHHHYQGTVQMDGSSEFRMVIATVDRKGIFHDEMCPGSELCGTLSADGCDVSIRLPFAAGGCNDGVGGLLWVSLVAEEEAVVESTDVQHFLPEPCPRVG
eukprot:Skav230871  [mRNA]  locus=scaffold1335:399247:399978:- [translate_table: standard]